LGGQLPHPAIGPMRRHEPIKYIPRHLLQNLVKDAIVMLHGIAPLVSGSSPNVPNRVESMPCALSTKTQPDSRGTGPAMTVGGGLVTGANDPCSVPPRGPMRRRHLIAGLATTVAGWPHAVLAQQKAMPLIGFVS